MSRARKINASVHSPLRKLEKAAAATNLDSLSSDELRVRQQQLRDAYAQHGPLNSLVYELEEIQAILREREDHD